MSPKGRPFAKGQSGNPGGRPKGIASTLKARYGDDGRKILDEIEKIAKDKKAGAHVRLSAWQYLCDRGWGKPTQAVNMDVSGEIMIAKVVHEHID